MPPMRTCAPRDRERQFSPRKMASPPPNRLPPSLSVIATVIIADWPGKLSSTIRNVVLWNKVVIKCKSEAWASWYLCPEIMSDMYRTDISAVVAVTRLRGAAPVHPGERA